MSNSKWFVLSLISLFVSLCGYAISTAGCMLFLVSLNTYLALTLPFFIVLAVSFCSFCISSEMLLQEKQIKEKSRKKHNKKPLKVSVTIKDNIIYFFDKVA